jgi:hypothetical protein
LLLHNVIQQCGRDAERYESTVDQRLDDYRLRRSLAVQFDRSRGVSAKRRGRDGGGDALKFSGVDANSVARRKL